MPPRTRISEAPKRISTRDPHQQRRSSSDCDPLHHRPITERSPRLFSDRRSPRGSQSDPLTQRKLGTRISDLESQLVQAQRELKNLKQQLASAESAKDEPPKKTKKHTTTQEEQVLEEETHKETDVYEVPMEKKVSIGPMLELEMDKPDSKDTKLEQLRAKLDATEKEFKVACEENDTLKKKLDEVSSEMAMKQTQLEKELEKSNETKIELMEKVKTVECAKEELEVEMKKLRVQTEQWRKAADAAAAVLAGGGDVGGRVSERCGSMEKHFNSVFEPPPVGGGYPVYLGVDDDDDVDDDHGKRKGSGIRMFGDLWRKKGHK